MALTPRRRIHPIAIAGAISLLAGGILLALDVSLTLETREFLRGARSAEATIRYTEIVDSRDLIAASRPIVQYADSEGNLHEAQTVVPSSGNNFTIGERLTILYNHEVSEDIRLDDAFTVWLPATTFLGVGGLLALVGAFAAFLGISESATPKSSRHARRAATGSSPS